MDNRSELTKQLLNCIAKHLSGRQDCRGKTYRVVLCTTDDSLEQEYGIVINANESASFNLGTAVFPDRYHRKDCDKLPVIEHIALYHFPNSLYAGRTAQGAIKLNKYSIVPGIYEYQPSIDNKRRRWIRVK